MSVLVQKWDKFHTLYESSMKGYANNKLLEDIGNEIDYQKLKYPCKYTVNGDTLLHVAICGGFQEKSVIKILDKLTPNTECIIRESNKVGDTILHEAARTGMRLVAKILIEKDQELLVMRNQFGEIPLFKAVQLGYRDMFCFLAGELEKRFKPTDNYFKYLFRKNNDTILHQAILNDSFGIAVKIIKWYPELVNQRNGYHLIGLQLLSGMTSAFKSGSSYGLLGRMIYYCLPYQDDGDDGDDEFGNQNKFKKSSHKRWSFISFLEGIPIVKTMKEEKRKHQYAFKLAKYLIAADLSWDEDYNESDTEKEEKRKTFNLPSLLIATSRGIVEIVDEMLRVYPQAVEIESSIQQNILHIAVKHRQLEIFEKVVEDNKLLLQRLVRMIDKNGNSILHHLGNLTHSKATKLAPAFQLQEELCWFERVQKITPLHYKYHVNKGTNKNTPWKLFEENHQKMLETSQEWIKRTSESCSTVAVLIATVAFAAAYTVPGGSDEKGSPILIGQLFFNIFIVTDVFAIASSLTAVVMFLSILTTPFEIKDFRRSLPYRLHLGFGFLFLSVAMTMLSFVATIILIIQLKKRWHSIVVYSITFLPVSVLALLQLPFLLMFEIVQNKVLLMIKHNIKRF